MISEFKDKYAFLSNFYPSVIELKVSLFTGDDRKWPTVEHAYQALKTMTEDDAKKIKRAVTPGTAKRRGQKIVIRADWEEVKLDFMYKLVKLKFEQNPLLKKQLLETGDQELIEGNSWKDFFWGICDGKGQNHLGKILMRVRKELA